MRKIYFGLFVFVFTFVLVGCFDTTKVKVSFDLNYENAPVAPLTQTIDKGTLATEPIEPTRVGYKFLGWFRDQAGTQSYSFNQEIHAQLKLYAKWELIEGEEYFLAGNFSSYSPNNPTFKLTKVTNEDNMYTITVELTEANRDKTYDGHYYKVTNGTWNADGCWGVDKYYINPAPLSPTGGGLGSIWHWANGTLTVTFNALTKEIHDTLEMVEPIKQELQPTIYGKFSNWVYEGEKALVLEDNDQDGTYTGIWDFTEAGTSDATLILSKKWYDDAWGQRWGADLQIKFDGTPAGMGNATEITFEVGSYFFQYNSLTKVTTYEKLEAGLINEFEFPRIYGAFNGWDIEGQNAHLLTDSDQDGIYTLMLDFSSAGSTDVTTVLSRKWYDDEWGKRWGAETQFKMDGTPAGMGNASTFEYEAGTYLFKYNSKTHQLTTQKIEAGTVDAYEMPRIYGAFNGWDVDGINAKLLQDTDQDGIYTLMLEFKAAGSTDVTTVLSRKWYDDEWGKRWGAETQFKMDGTPAGMGNASTLEYEAGTYLFKYNASTNVLTVLKVEAGTVDEYEMPRIYGAFNGWNIDGPNAKVLHAELENTYTVVIEFTEAGTSDFTVCLSRKWYDDQWGKRWGAETQYKLDGTLAGMGNATSISYEVGTYIFTYDSVTHITTYTKTT